MIILSENMYHFHAGNVVLREGCLDCVVRLVISICEYADHYCARAECRCLRAKSDLKDCDLTTRNKQGGARMYDALSCN